MDALRARVGWILGSLVLITLLFVRVLPPRPNLGMAFSRPEAVVCLLAGIVAMIWSGRPQARSAVLIAFAVTVLSALGSWRGEMLHVATDGLGLDCLWVLLGVSALSFGVGVALARWIQPPMPRATLLAGSAWLGSSCVLFYCVSYNPLHDLIWHLLPAAALAALSSRVSGT